MESPVTPTDTAPWYRQFWPWFLIGVLLSSVVLSSIMVFFALDTADGVVVDYYRKDGLAYREDRARDTRALQMGLNAVLEIEQRHVEVVLDGSPDSWPQQLRLLLVHPTQAHRDATVTLNHLGGNRYAGQLETPLQGRRTLHLTPPDESWRLYRERLWFPLQSPARLYSRLQGS